MACKWCHFCRQVSWEVLKTHEVAPDIFDFSKVAHVGFEFDITALEPQLMAALISTNVKLWNNQPTFLRWTRKTTCRLDEQLPRWIQQKILNFRAHNSKKGNEHPSRSRRGFGVRTHKMKYTTPMTCMIMRLTPTTCYLKYKTGTTARNERIWKYLHRT